MKEVLFMFYLNSARVGSGFCLNTGRIRKYIFIIVKKIKFLAIHTVLKRKDNEPFVFYS